jgi:hypothetical protein
LFCSCPAVLYKEVPRIRYESQYFNNNITKPIMLPTTLLNLEKQFNIAFYFVLARHFCSNNCQESDMNPNILTITSQNQSCYQLLFMNPYKLIDIAVRFVLPHHFCSNRFQVADINQKYSNNNISKVIMYPTTLLNLEKQVNIAVCFACPCHFCSDWSKVAGFEPPVF